MVRFIPAEELKSKFGVFGHFYSVQVAPKRVIECRSVLEIVESDQSPRKMDDLSHRKPDAVFIILSGVGSFFRALIFLTAKDVNTLNAVFILGKEAFRGQINCCLE